MSDVKRYRASTAEEETQFNQKLSDSFVLASDFDAAQAELAALREELADTREAFLNQSARLVGTEQRNSAMSKFLKRMLEGHGMDRLAAWQSEMDMVLTDSAPQPTESLSGVCTSCDGSGEYIDAIGDWRGYCSCSSGIELKNRPAPVASGVIAEQKCETCHGQVEVFVSKGKVEYGMLTEPDPIYIPCPDCAEPANKERAQ